MSETVIEPMGLTQHCGSRPVVDPLDIDIPHGSRGFSTGTPWRGRRSDFSGKAALLRRERRVFPLNPARVYPPGPEGHTQPPLYWAKTKTLSEVEIARRRFKRRFVSEGARITGMKLHAWEIPQAEDRDTPDSNLYRPFI